MRPRTADPAEETPSASRSRTRLGTDSSSRRSSRCRRSAPSGWCRARSNRLRELVRDALRALGIRRLLLAVHDLSLPGDPGDDIGRGAPLSRGGRGFLEFAANLGFHGLQLGPQGETDPQDPSPYDATLFSRNISSIGLAQLVEERLAPGATPAPAGVARSPGSLLRPAHVTGDCSTSLTVSGASHRAHADATLP